MITQHEKRSISVPKWLLGRLDYQLMSISDDCSRSLVKSAVGRGVGSEMRRGSLRGRTGRNVER